MLFTWGICPQAIALPSAEPPAENRLLATAGTNAIATRNNQFAFDIYEKLRTTTEGSIFFSPYSLSVAMAMTYAGARNQTANEIAKVFHFQKSPETLHLEVASLLNAIQTRTASQLSIVNRLWGQSGYPFEEPFLEITQTHYNAPLTPVDFKGNTEASRQQINNWVGEQTNDKIPELIPASALDPSIKLVLVNAIYFKASWLNPFSETQTSPDVFNLPSGQTIRVPMMKHSKVTIPYKKLPDVEILELPYISTDNENIYLAMTVLLPSQDSGLEALEKNITPAQLESWIGQLEWTEIEVGFPKFKLTSSFDMKSILSSMGMASAFTPEVADFSGITSKKPFFLDDVVHKAFVDVNEQGTEAAAASAVTASDRSFPSVRIKVDRPFLFLIRDIESGTILFLGSVVNPLESSDS